MSPSPLACPQCRRPIEIDPEWASCRNCETLLYTEVFPAFFRESVQSQIGEILLTEGESCCFYHEGKKAILPCQGCGRFLCGLCDCELNGGHYCPACLEAGKSRGKIKNLENHRVMYDSIALYFAVLPLATVLFWFMTLVTAPIALFVSIRYWSAPLSIVRRSRVRYVVASVVATLQLAGWGIGLYALLV